MIGTTIGGFTILREIGRGGMGVVYEAEQTAPQRKVALKVLPPEMAFHESVAARFAEEANKMARLEGHPNIASVYAAGKDGDISYFAMQMLQGDLEQRLQSEAQLHLDEAVEIAAQVAEALDHAHNHGVVHRDIKPANIMFNSQGTPVVTDFGIAKAADEFKMTQTGMSIGTPQYASPEQIKGNPVDGRADLYSLGVVLYQMVCGKLPFDANTPVAFAVKHMTEAPPPPGVVVANLPPGLEQIILRCLAKEPSERFLNGKEMAFALRNIAVSHIKCTPAANSYAASAAVQPVPTSVSPPQPQPAYTAPQSRPRNIVLLVLAVIGILVFIVGAGTLTEKNRSMAVETPLVDSHEYNSAEETNQVQEVTQTFVFEEEDTEADEIIEDEFYEHPEPNLKWYNGNRISILQPSGWTPKYELVSYGSRLSFNSGQPNLIVKVEWTPNETATPWETYHDLNARFEKAGKGYQRIAVEGLYKDGHEMVWWEFQREGEGGVMSRTIDCFVTIGDRGYAILCRAPVSQWDEWEATFHMIIDSFSSQ